MRLTDWLKGERSEEDKKIIFRSGGMNFPVYFNDVLKQFI